MKKIILPVLGLALLCASPSLAQAPYPGQGAPGQDYEAPPSPQVLARRLHDALHLRPDQEGAWRAYQEGIQPDPQQTASERQAQMLMPNLPTPRRLALMKAQMQSHMVSFDHDAQVVRAFYAALTPEQQRIFDQQTARAPQD